MKRVRQNERGREAEGHGWEEVEIQEGKKTMVKKKKKMMMMAAMERRQR
jgi:hypothetical protein